MPIMKNTVSTEIYGHAIRALVDTGATISCVALSLLSKLGIDRSLLRSIDATDAVAVGGEKHCSLGALSLPISFSGFVINHSFQVYEHFHQPLILGLDFLKANDAIFNIAQNSLSLRDPVTQSVLAVDINSGTCRLKYPVTIEPHSVSSVQVYITNIARDSHVLLEPSHELPTFGLAGAKCLVDTLNTNTQYLQILNPTDDTITLSTDTVVASACTINPDTVLSLDSPSEEKVTYNEQHSQSDKVDFDLSDSDLTSDEKKLLLAFLHKHKSVFATDLTKLGKCDLQPHRIETGNNPPVRQRFYRQSPQVNAEMNRQLEEMLNADIIEESSSMWQSPVVMVKKKNGELRFAVDYRKLNAITQQHTFPLPRLEDVFDTIGISKAKIFSTLDLASGFWQIPMDPETAHKSAFVTPTGVFQWKRMPFGLVNAPASFQALMTQVLRGLNWKTCLVYVDDILVFSANFSQHLQHLNEIFERLTTAGLTLKPSKCSFARKQVQYLGHVITRDGVQVDVTKTDVVQSFPVPRCSKDVRSFLGLCNYYKKFIKNYSTITSPLNALLCKDTKFTWSTECESAFTQLKQALTSPPVLAYPDNSKPYFLTTDASGTALGFILGQFDDTRKERVIAYGGRSLNKFEKAYSIAERECLAIIEGIKKYHVYLAGKPFYVYTDHSALKWLQSVKHDTGRLARWSILLQGYNFQIIHRKGKNNEAADALSRRPYPEYPENATEPEDAIPCANISVITTPEENHDHNQVTFFYKNDHIEQHQEPNMCPVNLPDSIGKLQQECPDFGPLYAYFKDGDLPTSKPDRDKIISESNHFVYLDDTLYHFHQPRSQKVSQFQPDLKQLAVPRCLREDVLRSYHDCIAGGAHLGLDRTYRAIQLKYYWKGMYQNVADYIRSCDECQHSKKQSHPARAPLVNMPVEDTFSRLHMDILGPLTTSEDGYKYILLVVDSFSKFPEAFPLKTQESKEIAQVLFSQIFARYGAPRVIVSDRGQNFLSKLVTAVCEIFQVTRHFTSAYHPQTNSACERMNSTIAQCLRTYVNKDQTNWPSLLPGVMMALRMSPSTQTSGLSPYHLLFGKEMNLPFDTSLIPKDGLSKDAKSHVTGLMSHLKIVKDIATQNIKKAQVKQKEQYDKKTTTPNFRIGQSVLMHTTRVPQGLSPKLHNPWDGPFYIAAIGPNNTYKIRRCSTHKELKSYIHANRLKAYNNPTHRPLLDPPTDHSRDNTHLPPNTNVSDTNVQNQDNGDSQCSNDPVSAPTDTNSTQTSSQSQSSQASQSINQNTSGQSPTQTQAQSQTPYHVEKLLRYKYDKGKKIFRVQWVGYSERTWEPEENLPPVLVRQFHITKTQRGTAKKKKKKGLNCFKQKN
ncbi:hypothetical protein FSP39_009188 [Pinctada imbricata]|uniref:RNA-directed DNA polymerase n=1 Tax=Pinctada imbricata TaxID=66713 RepID=A0AA89BJ36_PINIB|nr:hypothetical protein FSP39_009188 [Pinctada imbricata]